MVRLTGPTAPLVPPWTTRCSLPSASTRNVNITIHFFSPNLPSSSCWAAVAFTIAKACAANRPSHLVYLSCAQSPPYCSMSIGQGSCRELWQISAFPARLGIADINTGQTETSNLGDAFISSAFQTDAKRVLRTRFSTSTDGAQDCNSRTDGPKKGRSNPDPESSMSGEPSESTKTSQVGIQG